MRPSRCSFQWLPLAFVLLTAAGCRVTNIPIWHLNGPLADSTEIERIHDVTYYDGPDANSQRHRLDLFLPKGKRDFPVVVLVHGGAWMVGDNRCCGLYSSVGEFLASQGIGAVLPTYRQSPGVKHPEHAKDVARAIAWTKAHMRAIGGRPDDIFLMGHSAGGHLVALLATDDKYLHAEGISRSEIRGVVSTSGVYRVPDGKMAVTLGGRSSDSFRLNELAPLRRPSDTGRAPILAGIPLSIDVYGHAFGDDPEVRADASPINHIRPGLPPFLLFTAEHDLPSLPEMAEEFHQTLLAHGNASRYLTIADRNHNSIQFHAIAPNDPVAHATLDFIWQNRAPEPKRALRELPVNCCGEE